ncbi:MAG: hypothetical protein WC464_00210 [Bdellovibrionales bacterium]|jgi:hypothetical protein
MKITLKKERGSLLPYSDEDYEALQKLSDAVYTVDIKNLDMRTVKQNSAIHLWCSQIAEVLNKNNLYMTGIFSNDIMWSMELVKEQIIKNMIKLLFKIDSTTKLKRKEIDVLIDHITYIFGDKKGITIPRFPSRELWDDNK